MAVNNMEVSPKDSNVRELPKCRKLLNNFDHVLSYVYINSCQDVREARESLLFTNKVSTSCVYVYVVQAPIHPAVSE